MWKRMIDYFPRLWCLIAKPCFTPAPGIVPAYAPPLPAPEQLPYLARSTNGRALECRPPHFRLLTIGHKQIPPY